MHKKISNSSREIHFLFLGRTGGHYKVASLLKIRFFIDVFIYHKNIFNKSKLDNCKLTASVDSSPLILITVQIYTIISANN